MPAIRNMLHLTLAPYIRWTIRLFVLECFLSTCLFAHPLLLNQETDTHDLVILAGGQGKAQWTEEEKIKIATNEDGYIALGTFSCVTRVPQPEPIDLTVWGRGVDDILFFEFPPHMPEDVTSSDQLRTLLFSSVEVDSSLNDRQQLEALVLKSTPDSVDATLKRHRQVVYTQMQRLNVENLQPLWDHWMRQDSLLHQATPEAHLQLYNYLHDQEAAYPVLRTSVFSATTPQKIGYLIRLGDKNVGERLVNVFVAARDAEPEVLPLTLAITPKSGFFSSAFWKNTILPPAIIGVVGAIVGYVVFLIQQWYLREKEREKKFAEQKIEHSKMLWGFFKPGGDYTTFKGGNQEEEERLGNIRKSLMEEGIYALLTRDVVVKITTIFDPQSRVSARLDKLHKLLDEKFGEFMH